MRIPVWLALGVAVLVGAFGAYRLYLGLRKEGELTATPKRGLYAMSKRTHLLVGAVYLLLAIGLTATAFGWNPFGSSIGPSTETPKPGQEPSKEGLPK